MIASETGPQVIIVGAGPGGAVLGFLLAQSGVRTALIERHTDFSREFRGEVLMPGGLEPFEQMGLWRQLDDLPHVVIERIKVYTKHKQVVDLEFSESILDKYRPRWISQPDLLEMLVNEAARFPNFKLIRGATVREVIHKDDRVVGVTLASKTGAQELRGDFVVGADGRASRVRACSNVTVERDPLPMDVVWIRIPKPEQENRQFRNEARLYVGGGNILICAPTPDEKLQLAWIIAKGSFRNLRSRGFPALIDEMAMHVDDDLARHLRRCRKDGVSPFLLSTVSDHVQNWTTPGMLLIGDAAHTMSPVGAQGLNMAIRDAIVAANHLRPVFRLGSDPSEWDAAAQRVQQERTEEIRTIQRFQSYPPRILFKDVWWTRTLLWLLPYLSKGRTMEVHRGNLLSRILWGTSDVRLAETEERSLKRGSP